MSSDEQQVDEGPQPFLAAMQQTVRPEVLDRAGDLLAELVEAVGELNKKGRLVFQLDIAPNDRVVGAVEVTARVKATKPEPAPVARIMWTYGQRLVTSDPRQQILPGIRPVRDSDEQEAAQ